jgi:cysteine desulfurase/selenocysteine lyase
MRFAYLNNSTASFPKCQRSIDALTSALMSAPVDIRHDAPSKLPSLATLKSRVARVLGCNSDEVHFVPDATYGLNCVIQSAARSGMRIVFDNRSHNAVIRPAMICAGANASAIDLYDSNDELRPTEMPSQLGSNHLLCLTAMSNVSGTMFDIPELISTITAKNSSVQVLVDASQAAGLVDLASTVAACDYVVFPGHKYLHAPPGCAVLVAKRPLQALLYGGNGVDAYLPDDAYRFQEVGTANYPAAAATTVALEESYRQLLETRSALSAKTERLWDALSSRPQIHLIGQPPGPRHIAIVSFSFTGGQPPHEASAFLFRHGITVRAGHHCSPLHHEQLLLRVGGSLRLSPSRFTSEQEVDLAIEAIIRYIDLTT